MARTITTREEWNAIPAGGRVLVRYTGNDGDGPGEVVFVRFAETVRYPYGPTRVSGGDNWDALWDDMKSAALLSRAEADARSEAEEEARLQRAIARYREVSRQKDEEFALLAKPFGGLRLALRRFWG
jgi:hypothetical protein